MEQLLLALRAVAEPTRLRLLVLCAHMDLTVSQSVQILGQSQPRVSRHLRLLAEAGLLERLREGGWVFYRIARKGPIADFARSLVDAVDDDDPTIALDFQRLEGVRAARAKAAADYFSCNAERWDEIRSLHVDERQVEKSLLDLLADRQLDDLLDIGTGTGRIIEVLSPRVARAVGVDLSHDMLTIARANLERKRLRNCAVQHGDMYQLPMAGASFDAVTIHQVLHFAERPEEVVGEAARVLRPGGLLVIVDFRSHGLDYLREAHEHRWLGFADEDVAKWCRGSGLEPDPPAHLAGDPLTVAIWSSRRPANDTSVTAA